MSASILILGGGCFGLTAALELRTRGWQVTVIDQGRLPHPEAAASDISKVVRMNYGKDEQHTAMGKGFKERGFLIRSTPLEASTLQTKKAG